MTMKDTINDFCIMLTGKTATNFDPKELGNMLTVTGLETVRLIVGYDRIKRKLPDAYYPAIVLEPTGGTKYLHGDMVDGTIEFWLQVGVRTDSVSGGLFGDPAESKLGIADIIDTLTEELIEGEYFSDSVFNLESIEDLGENTTEGLFIGYRFYSLRITYKVVNGLRGFQ